MKTILVTGGAGFIGSNLIAKLLADGERVICIDNFDDLYDPALKVGNLAPFISNPSFVLYRVDIRDMEAFRAMFVAEHPTHVVHLAARPDTRDAVKSPHMYIDINLDGSLNVFELCKEFGVKNLVFASSSSVYGNNEKIPWVESESADRPLSPYGATKRAGELIAYSYHHNFNLSITCLRYFNAYGENNRPTMVPYIWTEKILKGEEIEISGDGSRKRDYTYIGDVVDATIKALNTPLGFEIINVGNSSPVSLKELLAIFEKVTGRTAIVKSRPSHQASVESTYADVTKAQTLLNWEPTTSLEEGITRLVTWFRAHRL